MHELSIAMNIVEIVDEHCRRENGSEVSAVELEIGKLSGVVVEALHFALESAKAGSPMQNAIIEVHTIEGKARCTLCGHPFETLEYVNLCPVCNSFSCEIIQGKEMKVKSIQIVI